MGTVGKHVAAAVLLLPAIASGCRAPASSSDPSEVERANEVAATPAVLATASGTAEARPSPPVVPGVGQASPVACGTAKCYRFESSAAAIAFLLRQGPRVLALGEAHAQAGSGVEPTVKRFERELLPALARASASALVVELLSPARDCEPAVATAREVEREVTTTQRPENKNEYVQLGHAAKALGVVPFILEPSCKSYRAVLEAGDARVQRMLELIASETGARLIRFFERQQAAGKPSLLLAYGGALHNDVVARPGREKWTFGPALLEATAGRYIELDLVAPEQIGDSAAWTEQPWYKAYRSLEHREGVVLVEFAPHGYALLFEPAPPSADPVAAEPAPAGTGAAPVPTGAGVQHP